MTTATLAAAGPMASTPAEIVLACAAMFLLANSFATAANSLRYASARSGVIRPAARSIDAFGSCGVKVADASATLLAMPTTSAMSARMVRSGTVHCV